MIHGLKIMVTQERVLKDFIRTTITRSINLWISLDDFAMKEIHLMHQSSFQLVMI